MEWRDWALFAVLLGVMGALIYTGVAWRQEWDRQQVYGEGWNGCLEAVRQGNPDYVLPPLVLNLSNLSVGIATSDDFGT